MYIVRLSGYPLIQDSLRGPLVCAGEVVDEGFGELNLVVNVAGLQAVKPCPGCALEHERDVLHNNAVVAVRYADGRGVVD